MLPCYEFDSAILEDPVTWVAFAEMFRTIAETSGRYGASETADDFRVLASQAGRRIVEATDQGLLRRDGPAPWLEAALGLRGNSFCKMLSPGGLRSFTFASMPLDLPKCCRFMTTYQHKSDSDSTVEDFVRRHVLVEASSRFLSSDSPAAGTPAWSLTTTRGTTIEFASDCVATDLLSCPYVDVPSPGAAEETYAAVRRLAMSAVLTTEKIAHLLPPFGAAAFVARKREDRRIGQSVRELMAKIGSIPDCGIVSLIRNPDQPSILDALRRGNVPAATGLNETDWSIIALLDGKSSPVSAKEIARSIHSADSTTRKRLSALVKRGTLSNVTRKGYLLAQQPLSE